MTHFGYRTSAAIALSLAAVSTPFRSSGAQGAAISQFGLFGGVNAMASSSPFSGARVALNLGGVADVHAFPFTVRLTGEFDQVPRGGFSRNVVSGAADVLSPSVALFRGARLYAFGGPGVYRSSGDKEGVSSDQGVFLLTVPTATQLGFNAGLALDFGHVFLQAKGVSTGGVAGRTFFPVSVGLHF